MANWNKKKVDPSLINGGKEFTSDDDLAVNELNAMVNNSFYGVDFVEAMADAPDISEIAGDGTPSVSLVPNGEFMKFKFSNLKGEKGEQGIQGIKGDKGDTGETIPNTLSIGSVVSGDTASATITGTAPNQVINLVLPKGEKGEKGESGTVSLTPTIIELYLQILPTSLSMSTNSTEYGIYNKTVFRSYRTASVTLSGDVANQIKDALAQYKTFYFQVLGYYYEMDTRINTSHNSCLFVPAYGSVSSSAHFYFSFDGSTNSLTMWHYSSEPATSNAKGYGTLNTIVII